MTDLLIRYPGADAHGVTFFGCVLALLACCLIGLILPAGLIYQRHKTRKGALIGLVVGTLAATIAGVLSNLWLMIPFYGAVYGMPVEQIVSMGQALIPAIQDEWGFVLLITGPFNLVKWILISVVTLLVYKPLSPLLHHQG